MYISVTMCIVFPLRRQFIAFTLFLIQTSDPNKIKNQCLQEEKRKEEKIESKYLSLFNPHNNSEH